MSEENTYRVTEYTVSQLAERGMEDLPDEMISGRHLIYSSPATLDFNSPGAQSFGVKRAGLSIPGSVMLLLSPGCCGRNTTLLAEMPEYKNRFFYLLMDETDIITGRHLTKVPDAVETLCGHLEQKPSVVMICITCVDALLGTDMERVCRNAEERVGLPVRPCYMYALTREGRKPPMVHVRQSLYSLLQPRKKKSTSVNLLGYFAPLADDSEIYDLLRQAGVKKIRELSRCRDYEQYQEMAEANFNLVLNPEARAAAKDFEKRLKIPSIELRRLYQIDRIESQYRALGEVLGLQFKDQALKQEAEEAVRAFREKFGAVSFSVGECLNGDPFELSLALIRYGFQVTEIYGTVTAENMIFLRHLAELSPEIRVYSNLEPAMIHHCPGHTVDIESSMAAGMHREAAAGQKAREVCEITMADADSGKAGEAYREVAGSENSGTAETEPGKEERGEVISVSGSISDKNEPYITPDMESAIHITLGKDAAYYHPDMPNLPWNAERQPFGYRAVTCFFRELTDLLEKKERKQKAAEQKEANRFTVKEAAADRVKGLRLHLAPFAPDQSGAVSVLYELGGLQVICDAGGCTGNICGFDEPRWKAGHSAIFSAGLRDMDAVMGRDDQLVKKTVDAAEKMPAAFVALIGTPVPAVIGTDYRGLGRMLEKKLPVKTLSVDADGTGLYDKGAEKAYLELFRNLTEEKRQVQKGRLGVIGANPLDLGCTEITEEMKQCLGQGRFTQIDCYGMGSGLEPVKTAGEAEENLVISLSGLAAAKYLQERFGTPYRVADPLMGLLLQKMQLTEERSGEVSGENEADGERITKAEEDGKRAGETENDSERIIKAEKDSKRAGETENDSERIAKAENDNKPVGKCEAEEKISIRGKKVMILQEQVAANALREELRKLGAESVLTATWFGRRKKLAEPGDAKLKEEGDLAALVRKEKPDLILGDAICRDLLPFYEGEWIDLPQFSVSGRLEERWNSR